jgi:hypothetical protein
MKKFILLVLISFQWSCTLHQGNKSGSMDSVIKPLIVLDDKDGEWGGDIRLSIVSISENDTSTVYKAISSDNNQNLGLLILVTKKKTNDKGFGNAITFKSIGKESDNLLQKLSKLYKQKISADAKFSQTVSANFVDLTEFAKSIGGTNKEANSTTGQYKLFFETKNDEGELFLNINASEQWLELSEKDPDYRPVIIKALSQ